MSLVSSLRKSVVSSRNGLPISSMKSTSSLTCFPKSSGNSWSAHGGLLCFLSRDASNSLVILKSSGPATTHRLRASGDWVQQHHRHSLQWHCFAHVPGPEPWRRLLVLRTVKLPFMNSMAASGLIVLRLTMSQIWTGTHLASLVWSELKNHGVSLVRQSTYRGKFSSRRDLPKLKTRSSSWRAVCQR